MNTLPQETLDRMKILDACRCRKFFGCPKWIPIGMLNEEWAQNNHGQSLQHLNSRGGLSLEEALAIIQKRKFYEMESPERAIIIFTHILKGYEIGIARNLSDKEEIRILKQTMINDLDIADRKEDEIQDLRKFQREHIQSKEIHKEEINFKNGDTMMIETKADHNWKLVFRFVNHAGNKDWSIESIDILDK